MSRRVNNIVAAFVLDLATALTEAVEAVTGQSGGLAAALVFLGQEPGVGVERLRGVLALSQPATVRLVNQLVADGLATRTRHESDGRRVHLELTPAGRERAREILAARAEVVDGYLGRLPVADQQALLGIVGRVYARRGLSVAEAERACRLCDLRSCPEVSCPIDAAARAGT